MNFELNEMFSNYCDCIRNCATQEQKDVARAKIVAILERYNKDEKVYTDSLNAYETCEVRYGSEYSLTERIMKDGKVNVSIVRSDVVPLSLDRFVNDEQTMNALESIAEDLTMNAVNSVSDSSIRPVYTKPVSNTVLKKKVKDVLDKIVGQSIYVSTGHINYLKAQYTQAGKVKETLRKNSMSNLFQYLTSIAYLSIHNEVIMLENNATRSFAKKKVIATQEIMPTENGRQEI